MNSNTSQFIESMSYADVRNDDVRISVFFIDLTNKLSLLKSAYPFDLNLFDNDLTK